MAAPLLQTKLFIPPARPGLVRRPRLIERLNEGALPGRKLILISAPAGFGKTTLLSEWNHALDAHRPPLDAGGDTPVRVAWLSLDEDDNDPARFLTYTIAALQTTGTEIGQGVLSVLQSPRPPPVEGVLTALINELAALPRRTVLVLDDYHLIEAQPIHDALTFLLRHLPPNVHLVIATREDPLLPLARLRARGQLTELRAADLRFSSSEAAAFLNQVMGLRLSADDIATLEARTEGWIAGLQLAAISMQGRQDIAGFIRSFTGSHHFVLDYLLEEVLHQQPERVQAFLLHTAILDRLTGPLCDALTGQGDGGATLERLQRANLFIVPLDNERRWYRYHHLFADLLRQRLLSSLPSGGIAQAPRNTVEWEEGGPEGGLAAELHTRASQWYEQNGFADEAIAHALRAQDFERAALLIDVHADAAWKRGEHVKLARWLAALPPASLRAKPLLYTFAAWYLFAKGRRDPAEQLLQAAEQALDAAADRTTETGLLAQPPDADTTVLRGRLAAIRALMVSWQGDAPAIIEHAQQALAHLPQQDPWRGPAAVALGDAYDFSGDLYAAYQARLEAVQACQAAGDLYFSMIASLKVAITLRALGRMQQVIDLCQQQLAWAEEMGLSQTAVAGCLLAQWGEALAERNDLDGALDRAKRGAALTEGGDLALLGFSYLCLVRVLFSVGDLAAAEKTVRKLEDSAREHDLPPFITQPTAAWRASLWLAQGKLEQAAQWASGRERDAIQGRTADHTTEHVALARVWLALGKLDEAIPLIQRLLKAAEAGARTSSAIEMLVLQALAFDAHGEPTRAVAALERALALAEPGGYLRTFVDQGPPMAALLYRVLSRGTAPDYVRRLLAAFPITEAEPSPSSALVEPLSERELEVLELIAQGLTNAEIASRLFLALNTVKAHTRNIYGKLGVHTRTEAAAKARALGLLHSRPAYPS